MKKLLSILLILTLAFTFVACTGNDGDDNDTTNNGNQNTNGGGNTDGGNDDGNDDGGDDDGQLPAVDVLTYAEYMAAEIDSAVTVDVYVQDTQSWWDNKISVYAADYDGAYFIYELACSEADAAKLTPGTKIRVSGYKAVWEGEIEITDATFTFVEGAIPYVAAAKDLTNVLAKEELIDYQNQLVSFKELTISSISYKNGTPGDDIYVTFTKNGAEYSFCVERYLTGPETDVYKAFETLQTGDVVDVDGFLYWYTGANTHITSISKSKSVGTNTYAEYDAAEIDAAVTIEAYVQNTQSWWDNKISVYAADTEGAYFIYELACSEADAAKLTPGTKIKVVGYKAVWEGEIEIVDATFTFVEGAGSYIADAKDVSNVPDSSLIDYQNQLVYFKDLTVVSVSYKNGTPGDDIYVNFTKGGVEYSFCVERYLTGPETDVYKAFETLEAGDLVDVVGYLYWYAGPNTHITSITTIKSAGAMTYGEYNVAEIDSEVTVEAYVQATQSWWDNKITVYAADRDGGYFFYEMACSEADAAKLIPGTKIRATGYKAVWEGEIEIIDATFTIVEGATPYVKEAIDLTESLDPEVLIQYQNQLGLFKSFTIKSVEYKNGTPGDDIYVTFTKGDTDYSFCVERYLTGPETDVYKAFETLQVGDVVDVEGFVYWYTNVNTHITKITKVG